MEREKSIPEALLAVIMSMLSVRRGVSVGCPEKKKIEKEKIINQSIQGPIHPAENSINQLSRGPPTAKMQIGVADFSSATARAVFWARARACAYGIFNQDTVK